MEGLLDLIHIGMTLAVPFVLGVAVGREWPRERKHERIGREFIAQLEGVHSSLTFCGEGVRAVRTMTVRVPGKPPLKLILTNDERPPE